MGNKISFEQKALQIFYSYPKVY